MTRRIRQRLEAAGVEISSETFDVTVRKAPEESSPDLKPRLGAEADG